MRQVDSIPVYHDNPRKLMLTFRETVSAMEAGDNILIFPENAATSEDGIFLMVYGLRRLQLTLSSLIMSVRLSLCGHFPASLIVPTLLRLAPGTMQVSPDCSIIYENGMSEVSGCPT